GQVFGTFSGAPNGAIIAVGGGKFQITYTATTVNLLRLPKIDTTTTLDATDDFGNPITASVFGQDVIFTATVSEASALSATGTVTFFDGGTILGTIPLNAAQQASIA